ncbi:MAG: DUF1015 domain-containing protein [Methanosarcinaceae archaeon]|nr:DUF1015 domain-containing protein [Methanosarcinaceae archaeon]
MMLHVPRILLPKASWEKWAVIACDQHTQDPTYWKRVEEFVGDTPSALNFIYPEIYLPLEEKRIQRIHEAMAHSGAWLKDHGPCLILVKRRVLGRERTGLIVAIDLEEYAYEGSDSKIRPTERTIKERLPTRVKIRKAAEIELSHVLVLYDDPAFRVLPKKLTNLENAENPLKQKIEQVYDFELMEKGGHITGYKIQDEKTIAEIKEKIEALGNLLVGDGNHSLAAAKNFWESLKGSVSSDHPARYALVELVNIHDPGLVFEPIHRVVKGVEPKELLKKFNVKLKEDFRDQAVTGQTVTFITKNRRGSLSFERVKTKEPKLEVESLDAVLENYTVEYEHDAEMVEKIGKKEGNIGFFLPPLKKRDFFALIQKKGVLPKKSFSLGEEKEKRYYLEARKLVR